MERVQFCRHCGELLENQWMHCPWCGSEIHRGHEILWEALVDDSMDKAGIELMKGQMDLLENLSGRLDVLEFELDVFLSGKL